MIAFKRNETISAPLSLLRASDTAGFANVTAVNVGMSLFLTIFFPADGRKSLW